MDELDPQLVIVGKIASAYGIKGWVNVTSFTDPVTNILQYQPWYLQSQDKARRIEPVRIVQGRVHGKQIVAQLEGYNDRNQAELLRGLDIAVARSQLPASKQGEYYWRDLIGMRVFNIDGIDLGVVDSLMETGANDVLVVNGDKQRLIPYVINEYIRLVDLKQGKIIVDWDPDF